MIGLSGVVNGFRRGAGLSCISWNAHVLLQYRGRRAGTKSKYLACFLHGEMVLAVQEARQSRLELESFVGHVSPLATCFSSFCDADQLDRPSASGGVAVIATLTSCCTASEPLELVPGRVLRVCLKSCSAEIRIYNIHNYGISPAAVDDVANRISNDHRWSAQDPFSRLVVVYGDFNFAAVDSLSLLTPTRCRTHRPRSDARFSARR